MKTWFCVVTDVGNQYPAIDDRRQFIHRMLDCSAKTSVWVVLSLAHSFDASVGELLIDCDLGNPLRLLEVAKKLPLQ
jgi:hypothetical protein